MIDIIIILVSRNLAKKNIKWNDKNSTRMYFFIFVEKFDKQLKLTRQNYSISKVL